MPARDSFALEFLEPRVLLSGDGLLPPVETGAGAIGPEVVSTMSERVDLPSVVPAEVEVGPAAIQAQEAESWRSLAPVASAAPLVPEGPAWLAEGAQGPATVDPETESHAMGSASAPPSAATWGGGVGSEAGAATGEDSVNEAATTVRPERTGLLISAACRVGRVLPSAMQRGIRMRLPVAPEVATPAEILVETLLAANGPPDTESASTATTSATKAPARESRRLVLQGPPATVNSPAHGPGIEAITTRNEIWSGGESYEWDILDVDSGVGVGWDTVDIGVAPTARTLTIDATSANPFTLRLNSLSAANTPGAVPDFNNAQAYSWTLVRTTGGITGFDRAKITLSRAAFTNPVAAGSAFVLDLSSDGRDLILRYLPALPSISLDVPTWTDQGPAPVVDNRLEAVAPNSSVSGAVQAVAVHPGKRNVVFVGTVNGGVWRTDDISVANPVWIPLTTQLPSLAIGALAISPFDNTGVAVADTTATNKLVLYAGTGNATNATYGVGGGAAGLFRSNDGGSTWTRADAGREFDHLPITSIALSRTTNNLILVGTDNPTNTPAPAGRGGLFWSPDAGAHWTQFASPPRVITDLVVDPFSANTFYVAVSGNLDANNNQRNDDAIAWELKGLWRLEFAGGTWNTSRIDNNLRFGIDYNRADDDHDGAVDPAGDLFESLKTSSRIRLAASPVTSGVLFVAIGDANGRLAAVWRSTNFGNSWAPLGAAPLSNAGGQAATNLSLVADPTNSNVVYVGGDITPNIFRGDFSTAGLLTLTTASADAHYGGSPDLPLIPINVKDGGVGVEITPTADKTEVTEGGATDTYSVVLRRQPTANVRIYLVTGGFGAAQFPNPRQQAVRALEYQVSAEDNAHAGQDYLEFTPGNWNIAQSVKVTAVADAVDERRLHPGVVAHRVESADPRYHGLGVEEVEVEVTDGNATLPGLTIVHSDDLTLIVEGGGTDTYSVRLDTAPTRDIRVNLTTFQFNAAGNAVAFPLLQARDAANPANPFLTFTAGVGGNWAVPQFVTVRLPDDGVGNQGNPRNIGVLHELVPQATVGNAAAPPGTPAEAVYLNANPLLPAGDRVAGIQTVDFNTNGLTILETNGRTEVTEGTGNDEIWIVLNRAPVANVTVQLGANAQVQAVDDTNPANPFLTFTAANWFTPQKVRVTAVVDAAESDTWTPVVDRGANGTFPHSDSRQLIFDKLDATGAILEVDDGGVYRLENPRATDATIRWSAKNGNLSAIEFWASIAWDSTSDTLFGGAQDNGVITQSAAGSLTWNTLSWGDGNFVGANGAGVRYLGTNNFYQSFSALFDAAGKETAAMYHSVSNVVNNGAGKVRITSAAHGLAVGDFVQVTNVTGVPTLSLSKIVAVTATPSADTFDLGDLNFAGAYVVGGLWREFFPLAPLAGLVTRDPIEVVSNGHGLNFGDVIRVSDEYGFSPYGAGLFAADPINATNFQLASSSHDPVRTAELKFWTHDSRLMLATFAGDNYRNELAADFQYTLRGVRMSDATFFADAFAPVPLAVNGVDPDRVALGLGRVYESIDGSHGDVIQVTDDLGPVANANIITALAYGGWAAADHTVAANGLTNVLYVARGNRVHVRDNNGNWNRLQIAGATLITDIVLDPANWQRAIAVDGAHVWFTNDHGLHWTNLAANLPDFTDHFFSVELLSDGNRGVLFVGARGGVFRAVVNDLRQLTAAGGERPVWVRFGTGLPNVAVSDIDYDATDDVMVVGTVGRGAWKLTAARASALAEPILRIETDDTPNTVELRLATPNVDALPTLEVVIDGVLRRSVPISTVRQIIVHTNGGDGDHLIVNSANGEIVVRGGIVFDGGAGANDVLEFQGTANAGNIVTTNPSPGTVLRTLGRERVTTVNDELAPIYSAVPAPVAAQIGLGLLELGNASLNLGNEELLGQSIPVVGSSLGSALGGATYRGPPGRGESGEGEVGGGAELEEETAQEGDPGIFNDGFLGLFRRLFETGDGAFSLLGLSESTSAISTPEELRQALDDLDSTSGNVTYDSGTQTFTVQIRKSISGNAGLQAELLGGLIALDGNLDLSLDVELNTRFGVDADGFFVVANSGSTPSVLTLRNLRIDGTLVGSGRFGLLDVTLDEGTLEFDHDGDATDARIEIALQEPTAGDGKIRLSEILDSPVDLFAVSLTTDPTDDDVRLTGGFTIAVLGLDGEPLFDLGTADVTLIWPDLTNPTEVRVEASAGGPGGALLQFLNFSPQEMVGELRRLLLYLSNLSETDLLDVEIPFTNGKKVGDLLDFGEAFVNRVFADLVDTQLVASTGNGNPSANLLLGRLTADAPFDLVIDDGTPISVSLLASATTANLSLSDLVADLNASLTAAFTAAGQDVKVRALLEDGKVTLELLEGLDLKIQGTSTSAAFSQIGFSLNSVGLSLPRFPSLQTLLAELEELLDPDGDGPLTFELDPSYDSTTKLLTFAFAFGYDYETSTSFSTDSGDSLGDLASFSAEGSFGLKIGLDLNFTFGIDFNAGAAPKLINSFVIPPPNSGRLSRDSSFTINVNDGQRFDVTISAAETAGFSSLAQLVQRLNDKITALAGSGAQVDGIPLNQLIRFAQATAPVVGIRLEAINEDLDADGHADVNEDTNGNGNLDEGEDADNDGRLDVLEDTDADGLESSGLSHVASLSIEVNRDPTIADADKLEDPVFTELGFGAGAVERTSIKGVFLQDVSLKGALELEATGLGASATFAIFGIEASGTATGSASVEITLRNPHFSGATDSDPTDDTRIDLGILINNLSHFSDYLTADVELVGSLDIHLSLDSIQPALVGMVIPAGSEFRLYVPDIRDFTFNDAPYDAVSNNTGLFITYPEIGPFPNFRCLGWTQVVVALNSLADQLESINGFGFLSDPLPLINVSIGDILDYAAQIATAIQGLSSGDGSTLDAIEADIEDLLGLSDENLEFTVDYTPVNVTAGTGSTTASATFNPGGDHNALTFTTTTTGDTLSQVRFVDEGTLTAGADLATVAYDATTKVLTITYNATYTRAATVLLAVNNANTANATAQPFRVALDTVADPGNDGSGVMHQTALKMALQYTVAYANNLPFQFSLGDLVALLPAGSAARDLLAGITDFIQIEGSGDVAVTASAQIRVVFGIDVSSSCRAEPFLYDSNDAGTEGTGITLSAAVRGTNLNFQAGIGALGAWVKNGTATLDRDGDPATTGSGEDATFQVRLNDKNGDGRHYLRSGEVFFADDNVGIELEVGASAVLPIYAPIESLPLGATTDTDGNGFPDNDLVVIIPSLTRLVVPAETEAVGANHEALVTLPFGQNNLRFRGPSDGKTVKLVELSSPTDPISAALDGSGNLEVRIHPAVTLASAVAALALPAGWSVSLDTASETGGTNTGSGKVYSNVTIIAPDIAGLFDGFNVCDVIRNSPILLDGLDALLGTIQDGLSNQVLNRNLPLVGEKLQRAADAIGDFRNGLLADIRTKLAEVGDPIALLQEAIFNVLGKPGLDLLIDPDGVTEVASASDVKITCDGEKLEFLLRLKKNLALLDTSSDPINIDLGLPSLGIEIDGNVQIQIGFDLKLYFGISASDGFYFRTDDPEELRLDFEITIPNLAVTGNLFFLQLQVADDSDGHDALGNARNPSSFAGFFTIDLVDPVGSGDKLTFADMTSSGVEFEDIFDAELGATAEVNLDLSVSFEGDARFPRLLVEFDLDWSWTLGGDDDGDLEFGFHNVRIDIGSFISQFVKPVLEEIQKVTGPIQPLVDVLTTPIPIISDLAGEPIDMLKLAELFGYLKPETREFIEDIATIIELVNDTSFSDDGSVLVPLGGFNLQRDELGNVERLAGDPDPAASDLASQTSDTGTKNFLQKLEDLGFTFPFLSISELFKLFRGEPIGLVEYHMPKLEFEARFEQSIPIYPPLYVIFGGEVGATIDLTFGYDTFGLLKFFGSEDKNVADIFDGFYVKDVNDAGEDIPEVTLVGGIFAGAELNLGIAEAGVTGGLFVEIEFNLNDPNDDGKVRVSEIIANAQQSILCIFDVHGELYVELTAFLEIHLLFVDIEFEWDFARITLLEFDLECPQPMLANFSGDATNESFDGAAFGGALLLNIGTRASARINGDIADGSEMFLISSLATESSGETLEINFNGIKQTFTGVKSISFDAGQGNDTVDLRGVVSKVTAHGGAGNDTFYAGLSGIPEGSQYFGDDGDDVITGMDDEAINDEFHGDAGADTLIGNGGDDSLYGDAGADQLYGLDGADTLYGGSENDLILGGVGPDKIFGEGGADEIEGGEDADEIYGGAGNDHVLGGPGNDEIVGNGDDDTLDGQSGDDIVLGDEGSIDGPLAVSGVDGTGNDLIAGGPGADLLFGAGGNDRLFGGTLLVSGSLTTVEADGQDFLDGGDGNDIVFADDAHGGEATSFPGANITGLVWYDAADAYGTKDHLRGADENGIANVRVDLYRSDATLAASTYTDATGAYLFVGLAAGDYYLDFTGPASFVFVTQNVGADDTLDSDADASGNTATFHVDSGATDDTQDAGLTGTATLIGIDSVSVTEGDTGYTSLTFTVTLSNASREVITVCYETSDDTANRIVDYTSADGTLTFQPGETTKSVVVAIKGDTIDEGVSELLKVTLSAPNVAVLRPTSTVSLDASYTVGTGTIIDDDDAPVISVANGVQVSALPPDLVPEITPMIFTVSLSNPSKFPITIQYTTSQSVGSDGQLLFDAALAGTDYDGAHEFTPQSVTINPGVTSVDLSVGIQHDSLDEYDETFNLTIALDPLMASNLATLGDAQAFGEIHDDDVTPYVRFNLLFNDPAVDSESVVEGHAGHRDLTLQLQLSNAAGTALTPSGRPVTIQWNLGAGSATVFDSATELADAVYTFDSVTLDAGHTTAEITVQVNGDTRLEPTEFFFVNLLSAINGQLDVQDDNLNHAIVRILNDEVPDPGPWYVQFSDVAYSVTEGDSATITLVRAAGSSEPVAVYWTFGGTAKNGIDYVGVREDGAPGTLPRGIVSFGPDETTATFTVPTLVDSSYEGDETVLLYLANPTGGDVRAPVDTAVLTIRDAQTAPTFRINDVSVSEGIASGLITFTITAELPDDTGLASGINATVDWTAFNGTALAVSDFSPIGPLTIAAFTSADFPILVDADADPETATRTVSVSLNNPSDAELTESMFVRLTNPVEGTISDYEGEGTILDDDRQTITGYVFFDTDANGFFDTDTEFGLANLSVTVEDIGGTLAPVPTDSTGLWKADVLLGNIIVTVDDADPDMPAGATCSTGNNPATTEVTPTDIIVDDIGFAVEPEAEVPIDSLGSGGGYNNDTAYGGPGNDEIDGGGGDDWLFGGHWLGPGCACSGNPYDAVLLTQLSADGGRRYVDPSTIEADAVIGDKVWVDTDGDGSQDAGEPGLAGVQVNLFDEFWSLIGTTWTDATGAYRFEKLAACNYQVQVLAPAGYKYSPKDASGNEATDSDVDSVTGLSAAITVTAGSTTLTVDAGLVPLAATGLTPWNLAFDHLTYSVRETDGLAAITVLHFLNSPQGVGVYFTANGTAGDGILTPPAPPADYVAARGTLHFDASQLERSFVVPVIQDSLTEGYETVFLYLFNPTGGDVTGNVPVAVLLIFDNPCPDDDVIRGGDGDDVLVGDYGYYDAGATEKFVLLGGMGNDELHGDASGLGDPNDVSTPDQAEYDLLFGEGGDDQLDGGSGNDRLVGGSENDTYVFDGDHNLGTDVLIEVSSPFGGTDTLDLSQTAGWSIDLDLDLATAQVITPAFTLTIPAGVIENARGGLRDDTLRGNAGDNVLTGGDGNDTLEGRGGDDTLEGGAGSDIYEFDTDGGLGQDLVVEASTTATNADVDRLDFSNTTTLGLSVDLSTVVYQTVNANLGLTLSDDEGLEDLYGGTGDDTLEGNTRDNVIWGREGSDFLDGGTAGYDVLFENRAGSWNLTPTSLSLGAELNTFAAGTFDEISLVGGPGNDNLNASTFNGLVRLDGAGGDDTLLGGNGTNYFTGGPGNDTIVGGTGANSLSEEQDGDFVLTDTQLRFTPVGGGTPEIDSLTSIQQARLSGGDGNNTLDASAFSGTVELLGGSGADTLIGTANADTLEGGPDNDSLNGGAGNDTYVFDADEALGTDTLREVPAGGTDTLDFSSTETLGVHVNLGDSSVEAFTLAQILNANLTLQLDPEVIENLIGSQNDDVLIGNGVVNVIHGEYGNDLITGGGADDVLDGGGDQPLPDSPFLQAYEDRVVEARDANFILTSTGFTTATLVIGAETDALENFEAATLSGGAGDNTLDASGFWYSVTLSGLAGRDILRGGFGADFLTGGAGNDDLLGGARGDTYRFDADAALGTDTLTEFVGAFAGTDSLDFSETATFAVSVQLALAGNQVINTNLTLNLSAGNVIEDVIGGAQNDTLIGNGLGNVLEGRAGSDRLEGLGGNDTLAGGAEDDTYVFDADAVLGTDRVLEDVEGGGSDTLDFSTTTVGVNVNLGDAADQVVVAGRLTLHLLACQSVENVVGGVGDDLLIGNALGNRLEGLAGDDQLAGRRGDDSYAFDVDSALGNDRVFEAADSEGGTDTLDFSDGTSSGITVDLGSAALQNVHANLRLRLTSIPYVVAPLPNAFEDLIGSAADDTITGNALANRLDGRNGNDTLTGSAGDDILVGGRGDDVLDGGLGNDQYVFDADGNLGADQLIEAVGQGADTLDFSATSSLGLTVDLSSAGLQAIAGANLRLRLTVPDTFENVFGGSGNDTLRGNQADNTLAGGAGNDTYVYDLDDIHVYADVYGTDFILEDPTAAGGTDRLDFSTTTTTKVIVDLTSTTAQEVAQNLANPPAFPPGLPPAPRPSLTLVLGAAGSVESVVPATVPSLAAKGGAGSEGSRLARTVSASVTGPFPSRAPPAPRPQSSERVLGLEPAFVAGASAQRPIVVRQPPRSLLPLHPIP